ncbi:hypothetical protein FHT36_000770 [Xanthobacter sp. SG618]|uniref:hypothetical protein n=1 Tax=Xanthobacter sp. SG618 TaxID=2587121 RepID=UPI00145DB889|nr:hypothetical protein [Xanthobacter sp. SG618]NMN56892.1 hypothetical protein [Xanthobacter sp. SG618]
MSPASLSCSKTHHLTLGASRDHVAALAEDMRELAAFTGAATEDELVRIGWTPDQLRDLGPAARKRLGPTRGAIHG